MIKTKEQEQRLSLKDERERGRASREGQARARRLKGFCGIQGHDLPLMLASLTFVNGSANRMIGKMRKVAHPRCP